MDHLELRKLRLLEALEGNQVLSQRELAQKLDISLGLVNSFIRRLAQKGYFKITTIPKNRVKYILTPKGLAEKSKLTYDYINYSLCFYKDARVKIKRVFENLQSKGVKRVIFYGTGHLAEIAYISLKETSLTLVGIISDREVGERFMGLSIESSERIINFTFDRVVYTEEYSDDSVCCNLFNLGVPVEKIVTLN